MTTTIDLFISLGIKGFAIYGAAANDWSGYSVSSAGDVNNDGFDDIIIGAFYASTSSRSAAGTSYVIYGNATNPGTIDLASSLGTKGFAINGAVDDNQSGWSVSSAEDINNDGFDDIIIGAPYADPSSRGEAGTSYVIYGNATNPGTIDLASSLGTKGFAIYGAAASDLSGYSVSSAGDVNGDGYNDIIIGAPYASTSSRSAAGTSYVIYGNATNPGTIDLASSLGTKGFAIIGGAGFDRSGNSVSAAGDVNGDGYDDIIIGAPYADPSLRYYAGTSYVIYGNATNPGTIDLASSLGTKGFAIYGAAANDLSGSSVSSAGDVNNDGFDDIIIGAYQAGPISRSAAGTSYVIYGNATNPGTIDLASSLGTKGFAIYGAAANDSSGYSVSSAGDINNDGFDDIIIGAYKADPSSRSEAGISYVIYGAEVMDSITIQPSTSPTASPTKEPSFAPTITFSPTFTPTTSPSTPETKTSMQDYINNIIDGRVFQVTFPVVSFFSSLVAGWFLRNKIVFHILNNWGYSYKLIDSDAIKSAENKNLQIDEIGLHLKSDKLFCRAKDEDIAVEINNGNNVGISPRLYEIIVQELTQQSAEPFILMQSEKNQIRDFLLSRGFINPLDLGYIRGTAYNICLNSYKIIHREKYAQQVRIDKNDANQNPLHNQIDFEYGNKQSEVEMRPSVSNNLVVTENTKIDHDYINSRSATKPACLLLSIDAMMDREHVRLQNEEFTRFGNQLINFINEVLSKDINLLLSSKPDSEPLLLEEAPKRSQTVTIYEGSAPADNSQFFSSNNLMLSLLSAKQIIYHLPLIHYVAQNSINYLGYNLSLSDPLDNKELLISVDLILGNLAAQYLPEQSIMNGIFISTASTVGYATRLMAAEYLKNQEPSEDPIELSMQCLSTIAAYSLPGMVNYALTRAILPATQISISTLDTLASSSFAVVQCYNNYKVVYGAENKATVTDVVVPYIADVITLWSLKGYLIFDTSNTANLMISIKNTMSVAATTYAAHCMSSMLIDVVPENVKKEHVNPAFSFASNTINDFVNTCYQSATDARVYITEEVSLIMDYIGMSDLKDDA